MGTQSEKWEENIKVCFIFLGLELFGTLDFLPRSCSMVLFLELRSSGVALRLRKHLKAQVCVHVGAHWSKVGILKEQGQVSN